MKNWYIIILICFVWACSPTKRLAKLLKKHPELLAVETVTVRDTVRVDGFNIRDSIYIDTSTSALNKALEDIRRMSAATVPHEVLEQIRTIYRYKRIIADTIRRDFPIIDSSNGIIDTIRVTIWQDSKYIGYKVNRKSRVFLRELVAKCPELIYKRGFFENIFFYSGIIFWILIILGLIGGYLYKQWQTKKN